MPLKNRLCTRGEYLGMNQSISRRDFLNGAAAYTDAAIDQAHRAVNELIAG